MASLPPNINPANYYHLYELFQQNHRVAFNQVARYDELKTLYWQVLALVDSLGFEWVDLLATRRTEAGLPAFAETTPHYLLPPGHERGF